MSVSEDNIKVSKEYCRCCLSRGHFKNINSTYLYMDEYEIYSTMIQECFKIELKPIGFSAICDHCITLLRSAFKFKGQVLKSEIKLSEILVKSESSGNSIKSDLLDQDNVKQYNDIEDALKEDESIKNEHNDELMDDNECNNVDDISLKDEDIKEDTEMNEKIIKNAKKLIKNETKKYNRSESTETRRDKAISAATLLKNCTATPFRWSCQTSFQCFYCTQKFTDITQLKQHTTSHNNKKLIPMLKMQFRNSTLAKIDINNLKCSICELEMSNLNEVRLHLTEIHEKDIDNTICEILVPFRLTNNEYTCQICGENFDAFILLNAHLNSHYGNFVCENCGTTFLSERRLAQHTRIHSNESHICKICNKLCPNLASLVNHRWKVHIQKQTYKCHCGDVFNNKYSRQKHRIDKHGERNLLHTCEPCNRAFPRKTDFNRHIRKKHLNERSYICAGNELRKHLVKQ